MELNKLPPFDVERSEMFFAENPLVDDDDGLGTRSGGVWSATAHIITAVIGCGLLSLAWAIAQLGWVGGPVIVILFSMVTFFNSTLLADCYRAPDPVTGRRNLAYMAVARAYLEGWKIKLCTASVYIHLVGVTVGYTIVASISMMPLKKSNCFNEHGKQHMCDSHRYSKTLFMIMFGLVEIVLSQIPNFQRLSWLSIAAALMGLAHSFIGIGLSIVKITGADNRPPTHMFGTRLSSDVTLSEKFWNTFQAIGDICFAYSYSSILVEIQDTVKSPPPEQKTTIKRASLIGVSVITILYLLSGSLGYAAFGDDVPHNFLINPTTFYGPYWLIQLASVCVVVNLMGTYQVFCQPIFAILEIWSNKRWPESRFITHEYKFKLSKFLGGRICTINMFRLTWRTLYVVVITLLAIIFPFFNDFLGLIGPISFWPLTVYLPICMHISQADIRKYTLRWMVLQLLNYACLVVFLMGAVGFIPDLVQSLKTYNNPF